MIDDEEGKKIQRKFKKFQIFIKIILLFVADCVPLQRCFADGEEKAAWK